VPEPSEIARILAAGEGPQVEFKEGLSADGRVVRAICAFANTRGGVIVLGVADRGRAVGIARPAAAAARLLALAADRIDPPVAIRTEVVRLGAKPLVWCSVPLSPGRPHAVSGDEREIVVRIGSSNRVAGPDRVSRLAPPALLLTPLDARVLAAVSKSASGMGVGACARELGVGKQRARQALEKLESGGRLVAHGLGPSRAWELPG
jgi:hypothetical protein